MFPFWNFLLEKRSFTLLLMVGCVVGGVASIIAIPKESTPEVVVPIGIVTTVLPGATASDVERLITDELEPAIRNVANIDTVTSASRSGVSVITAEFIPSADVDVAIQDLRNAVEGARSSLPSDAEVPTVVKFDFQNQPFLTIGIGTDLAPESLTALGEILKDDLISIRGVSRVEVSGTREREIAVIVEKGALAEENIRVQQIIQTIRSSNVSTPVGAVTIRDIEYPLQFDGVIQTSNEIQNIPLSTPTGEIFISDVATIIDGFSKPTTISRIKVGEEDTQFALTLSVYKASGESIIEVSDRVKERLKEIEGTILSGSRAVITYDAAEEVRTSIRDLTTSGLQTIILVLVVLFFAIGAKESLVAALSIPFSFVIAFIGMYVTGNTINFISLFALIIAIGILVDSGIVMVEGIHKNREEGMKRFEATQKAVKDFAWPLIAGTMTTVAVFVPLFFLSGIIGEFVQSIPFTIVVVLIASIFVALGFIPTISLNLIAHSHSPFSKKREDLWRSASKWYRKKMETLFKRRSLQWLFYGFLTVSFLGAFVLPVTGLLRVAMFPPSDADLFFVEVEMPQATSLQVTDEVTKKVEEILKDTPFLESLTITVGGTSPFSAEGGVGGAKFANITVNLREEREMSSLEITNGVREKLNKFNFKNAKVSVIDQENGPPSGAPIVVKVWSNDTETLALSTEMIARVVESHEDTRDITSSLSNDGTEITIAVDREKANEYGLSTADIASTIQTAVAGSEVTTLRVGGEDITVRALFNVNESFTSSHDTAVAHADDIRAIPLSTARGIVPLGALTTINANRTSAVINHEDGMRIGSVSAFVREGGNAVEVTEELSRQISALSLPSGVRVTYGGEDEEITQTFTEMLVALIAGLLLMFAILVLGFNSFRTSLRLLSAVPLSLTGVLWGLWIAGQPLSFTAFLGIIALAGVIINHGILLLDALNKKRESEGNESSGYDIVLDTAESRFRPIILTTVTTVVGMIPLTFVSAMWAPLAFTIAFGLIYGTLLTLVFIPLLSYRSQFRAR